MYKRISRIALFVLLAALSLAALDRQPNSDYRARRLTLAIKTNGSPVLLFAAEESKEGLSGFRQDDNFFYLSGCNEPGAALLIAPEEKGEHGHPYTEILFLAQRNLYREMWTGVKLGPDDPKAREITGFDRVEPLDRLRDELAKVLGRSRHGVLLTDTAEAPEETTATHPLQWLERSNAFMNPYYRDVKPLLAEMRVHKDAGELERIRHASDASIAAHRRMFKEMKPGLTELQVAGIMTGEFMFQGCARPAYAPIVGAGFNSTVLHYSENSGTIQDGDVVVMDVAGEYGMYASDITRTVPANGKFTARQREIYDIVLGAQREAEKAFVSGRSTLTGDGPDSLYRVAYDYINSHGKDLHGQPLGKYFIHGLGHYVGLNVHDVGEGPLAPGAVFTLEPGIYIPEEKLGVRIEDDYMVDKDGNLVDLTAALPHTADEVEAAMRK